MAKLTTTVTFSVADKNRCVKVALSDDKFFLYDRTMFVNDPGMFALVIENLCNDGHIEEGSDIVFKFEDGEEDLRSIAREEFELKDNVIKCSKHGHSVTVE